MSLMSQINDENFQNWNSCISKYVSIAKDVLDIGTGPNGSAWYQYLNENASLTGLDLYFEPNISHNNFTLYRIDAVELDRMNTKKSISKITNGKEISVEIDMLEKYDLVVADHIFEHVSDPERLANGIRIVTKKGGYVHIGLPDPDNFTDKFYHLIHAEGGGHISFIKKEQLIDLMERNGFELVYFQNWPDDWMWFEKLFDYKSRGIRYIDEDDIKYIANVFRKELTPEKGYFYGGEYIFRKRIEQFDHKKFKPVSPAIDLKVNAWGPQFAKIGTNPNKQPDGSMGIWIEVSGAHGLGEAQVLFSGHPAKSTTFQEKLITAAITMDQLEVAGDKEVTVRQIGTGKLFPIGIFKVTDI